MNSSNLYVWCVVRQIRRSTGRQLAHLTYSRGRNRRLDTSFYKWTSRPLPSIQLLQCPWLLLAAPCPLDKCAEVCNMSWCGVASIKMLNNQLASMHLSPTSDWAYRFTHVLTAAAVNSKLQTHINTHLGLIKMNITDVSYYSSRRRHVS